MTNRYRSYGTKKKMTTTAKNFGGQLSRDKVQQFKSKFPEIFSKLLAWQNGERSEGKRPEGRLKARHLYDFLYPNHDNTCATCGVETSWAEDKGCYREFCSRECTNNSELIAERRKETNLVRFGTENAFQSEVIKQKIRNTCTELYGVANVSQNVEIQEKKRNTMRKNFGADHWTHVHTSKFDTDNPMQYEETKDKIRNTCLQRYGVSSASQSEEVKSKIREVCLEKYGAENAGHIPHGYRRKEATDVFGVTHIVQGYEPIVIDWLGQRSYTAAIASGSADVGKIPYKIRGETKNYYPDLLLTTKKGKKILIEVKSQYTIRMDSRMLQAKANAASKNMRKMGGSFWLVVVMDDGSVHKFVKPKIREVLTSLNLTALRR